MIRPAARRHPCNTTGCFGGKELQHVIATLQQAHRLRGSRGTGQCGQLGVFAGVQQPVRRPWRHAKPCARSLGGGHIGRGQQGARADNAALDLGHLRDHLQRSIGAQRDLQRGQPPFDQRAGQGLGMGRIMHDQHWHNRRQFTDFAGGGSGGLGGHGVSLKGLA